jgi:hypothetical protein
MNNYSTAIFLPGIYYFDGSLVASGSTTLRMAKPLGFQRTDGVMFFFKTGSLDISGCSGCTNAGVDNVDVRDLSCDGSPPAARLNMPLTIPGNVLISQCTRDGTYVSLNNDTTDQRGTPGNRGLLVFQDHSNPTGLQFTGSGSLAFSGTLYLHSTGYQDVLSLSGGSNTGTFILGGIVTDNVKLTGSGVVKLALNPAAITPESKVALFF